MQNSVLNSDNPINSQQDENLVIDSIRAKIQEKNLSSEEFIRYLGLDKSPKSIDYREAESEFHQLLGIDESELLAAETLEIGNCFDEFSSEVLEGDKVIYGPSRLEMLDTIRKQVDIKPSDVVYDMGGG